MENKHKQEFHASGIPDEWISKCNIQSATSKQIKEALGWSPKYREWGDGWLIPFEFPWEKPAIFKRVKLDQPRRNNEDDVIKYEQPKNAKARLYIPPPIHDKVLTAEPLVITEGEKKAISACVHGFCCVGLTGVSMWAKPRVKGIDGRKTGPKLLIDDLARFNWTDRQVYICFDSDAAAKWHVEQQEKQLAEMLISHGALVKVIRLPDVPPLDKTGLDDYFVHHGPQVGAKAFQTLLDSALEAHAANHNDDLWCANQFVLENYWVNGRRKAMPTIRHYQSEFYCWDESSNRYHKKTDEDIVSEVFQWMGDRGMKTTMRRAKNIADAIGMQVHLASSHQPPCYLGIRAQMAKPSAIALKDCLVQVDIAADEDSDDNARLAKSAKSPEWFSTVSVDYDYDITQEMVPTRWLKFLDDVWGDDHASKALLQEWFGLCLAKIDGFNPQKILLMYGPPASGKGTILRVLDEVVGAENCMSADFDDLAPGAFTMGEWQFANVVYFPDCRISRGMNNSACLSRLLSITGGDKVVVNRKFKPAMQTRFGCQFMLVTNELPQLPDNAAAMVRRWLPLRFQKQFKNDADDMAFTGAICEQKAGIFWWAVEGWRRLNENRVFTKPAYQSEALLEAKELSSPIAAFLSDCCGIEEEGKTETSAVYDAYKNWSESNGNRPASRTKFVRDICAAEPSVSSHIFKQFGKVKRCLNGLVLLDVSLVTH